MNVATYMEQNTNFNFFQVRIKEKCIAYVIVSIIGQIWLIKHLIFDITLVLFYAFYITVESLPSVFITEISIQARPKLPFI